jgi:F0F1-type ATP synthase membrane subunit b/b'
MNPLRPEVEIKDLTYIQRDLKEHVRIMNENLKMVDDACKPGKERNKEIIEEKKAELQRLIKENEERLDNNELEDIVEPID